MTRSITWMIRRIYSDKPWRIAKRIRERQVSMGRNKISSLTKSELELVRNNANFTEEQAAVFDKLNEDKYIDMGIMNTLGMSNRRYYDVKKVVLKKIDRISKEFHFDL